MLFKKEVKNASKIGRKCLVGLLAITMSIGMGQVVSNAANATGTLGVCNITNPSTGQTTNTYNYVYFGTVPTGDTGFATEFDSSIRGNKILWRVLNTTANDDDCTPALFMLTEYSLPTTRAWDNTAPRGHIWDDYYTTGDYKT